MSIKNIIFDLGGVFIDIHFDKTENAFEALGYSDFSNQFNTGYYAPLFQRLETGHSTALEFYDEIRKTTGLPLLDGDITIAWNAMLGNWRSNSLALLPGLKERYQILLFSNTNAIHYEEFTSTFSQLFPNKDFNKEFHFPYYSHLLGQRKPNPASYLSIVEQHGLILNETVFIDDSPLNLTGAATAGLHTLELPPGVLLEDILPNFLMNYQ